MIDPLIERVEARIKDAAGHSDPAVSVSYADLRAILDRLKLAESALNAPVADEEAHQGLLLFWKLRGDLQGDLRTVLNDMLKSRAALYRSALSPEAASGAGPGGPEPSGGGAASGAAGPYGMPDEIKAWVWSGDFNREPGDTGGWAKYDAPPYAKEAVRYIRSDLLPRPELTDEMVERAALAAFQSHTSFWLYASEGEREAWKNTTRSALVAAMEIKK